MIGSGRGIQGWDAGFGSGQGFPLALVRFEPHKCLSVKPFLAILAGLVIVAVGAALILGGPKHRAPQAEALVERALVSESWGVAA